MSLAERARLGIPKLDTRVEADVQAVRGTSPFWDGARRAAAAAPETQSLRAPSQARKTSDADTAAPHTKHHQALRSFTRSLTKSVTRSCGMSRARTAAQTRDTQTLTRACAQRLSKKRRAVPEGRFLSAASFVVRAAHDGPRPGPGTCRWNLRSRPCRELRGTGKREALRDAYDAGYGGTPLASSIDRYAGRAADVQQRQSAALEVSYPSRTLQNQSRARVNGLCLLILSVTRQ